MCAMGGKLPLACPSAHHEQPEQQPACNEGKQEHALGPITSEIVSYGRPANQGDAKIDVSPFHRASLPGSVSVSNGWKADARSIAIPILKHDALTGFVEAHRVIAAGSAGEQVEPHAGHGRQVDNIDIVRFAYGLPRKLPMSIDVERPVDDGVSERGSGCCRPHPLA